MSYDGPTPTKFGWAPVGAAFRAERLHVYQGEPLREVDHEPPVPVLDQEDLFKQGIDTSELVPGAAKVDALGSCTCNAGTVSVAEVVKGASGELPPGITGDAVNDEKYAICLYHTVTDQTGEPAQEWPPTDCGSNGLYVAQELAKQGLIAGCKSASDPQAVVSLLQPRTVIVGGPWFNSWMEPDANGFIDGDGSYEALLAAVTSGVAGGHERCMAAIETLTLTATGQVDPAKTILRDRNSWSQSFADNGSYRYRLSTYQMLGHFNDYKAFVPNAAA